MGSRSYSTSTGKGQWLFRAHGLVKYFPWGGIEVEIVSSKVSIDQDVNVYSVFSFFSYP